MRSRREGRPPHRSASGRRWIFAVAILFAVLQSIAARHDLDWAWRFSEFRGRELLLRLADSVLDGRGPGLGDGLLLMYLAGALLFALSFQSRLAEMLGRHRRRLGYLSLVGLCTLLSVLALGLLLARPAPAQVLGGSHLFQPWYWVGAQPLVQLAGLAGLGGSPSLQTALAASCSAYLYPRGGERWLGERLPLAALILLFTGWMGLLSVYAQLSWPTDALAGAALGLLWPWLLHRRLYLKGKAGDYFSRAPWP